MLLAWPGLALFGLVWSALPWLVNCALDLHVDEPVGAGFIKRLRQRERTAKAGSKTRLGLWRGRSCGRRRRIGVRWSEFLRRAERSRRSIIDVSCHPDRAEKTLYNHDHSSFGLHSRSEKPLGLTAFCVREGCLVYIWPAEVTRNRAG